ncbi:MAG: hypothetical protein KDJ27_21500 [Gammaproteobacteria bacterium]|nr:hypothetical protein [Gammaproteobacteria bacterium]
MTIWILLHASYVVPLVLLAWLTISRPLSKRLPITLLLTALPLMYVTHHVLLMQLAGRPTDLPLPQRFRLIAHQITEPDRNTSRDGQILLWIQDDSSAPPRVHRLAYSRALHRELVAAGERQARGEQQVGIRGGAKSARQDTLITDAAGIVFQSERRNKLPDKDGR